MSAEQLATALTAMRGTAMVTPEGMVQVDPQFLEQIATLTQKLVEGPPGKKLKRHAPADEEATTHADPYVSMEEDAYTAGEGEISDAEVRKYLSAAGQAARPNVRRLPGNAFVPMRLRPLHRIRGKTLPVIQPRRAHLKTPLTKAPSTPLPGDIAEDASL